MTTAVPDEVEPNERYSSQHVRIEHQSTQSVYLEFQFTATSNRKTVMRNLAKQTREGCRAHTISKYYCQQIKRKEIPKATPATI